jgi:DNA-binding NarL/FixJ family response regulator
MPPIFPNQPRPVRVLLVDDDPRYCANLSAILSGNPRIVVVGAAFDGQQGVDRARMLRPDVVVLDVNMPRLDGFAAARTIRRDLPDARIVIVSGAPEHGHPGRAREAGADIYLPKDVDFDALTDVVLDTEEAERRDSNWVARAVAV